MPFRIYVLALCGELERLRIRRKFVVSGFELGGLHCNYIYIYIRYIPCLVFFRVNYMISLPQVSGDKEQHTVVHRAIREHFPDLESKTEDGEDPEEKVISVRYIDKKSTKHGENGHVIVTVLLLYT